MSVSRLARIPARHLSIVLAAALSAWATHAPAASLGLVSDNSAKRLALFDADNDAMLDSLQTRRGPAMADCSLTSDQSLAFSASASNAITFIELDQGGAPNQQEVAISNLGLDMSLSPDDRFLVLAGGGALQEPIAVIDTRLRREVSTAGLFVDHTSVEFCDDGTLLVTTTHGEFYDDRPDNALYDARIDAHGHLSLAGGRLSSGAQPANSACAPGSRTGVLLDREGGLVSFTLPDLRLAERLRLSGGAGVAAAFSADGRMLFVRTTHSVEAFRFDPDGGALQRLWVRDAPGSLEYFGMDQIALHPHGGKLYIDGRDGIRILDPVTGATSGRMPMGSTTGICFARTTKAPERPLLSHLAAPAAP